jgi:hypothetical protein
MRKSVKRRIIRNTVKGIPYIIILGFVIAFFRSCGSEEQLMKNYTFTNGTVLRFSPDYRGAGGGITYEFVVNGKTYENKSLYAPIYSSKGYFFVGRSFPVAYDSTDVNNNTILILPMDFKEFHISFPDSLEWIREYIRPDKRF